MHRLIALAFIAALSGCRSEDRIVIEMRHVELAQSQAEVVRAERLIKDFGMEVDSVDLGCRNGTFISITVTGRGKRWSDKYFDEREKLLELEKMLKETAK